MSQQVKSKLSIAATAAFDEISQILDKTNVSDARYNKNSFAWKKLIADLEALRIKIDNRSAFAAALSVQRLSADDKWLARHYWAWKGSEKTDFRELDAEANDPWDDTLVVSVVGEHAAAPQKPKSSSTHSKGKQLARTEAEDVEMADESPVAALKEDENTAPGPKEAKAADTSSSKSSPRNDTNFPGGPARGMYDPLPDRYYIESLPPPPGAAGVYLDSVAISQSCAQCFIDNKHCFPPNELKMDSDISDDCRCLRCATKSLRCKLLSEVILFQSGRRTPGSKRHRLLREAIVAPAENQAYVVGEHDVMLRGLQAEVGQLLLITERITELERIVDGLCVRELAREDPARAHAGLKISTTALLEGAQNDKLHQLADGIADTSRSLRDVLTQHGAKIEFSSPSQSSSSSVSTEEPSAAVNLTPPAHQPALTSAAQRPPGALFTPSVTSGPPLPSSVPLENPPPPNVDFGKQTLLRESSETPTASPSSASAQQHAESPTSKVQPTAAAAAAHSSVDNEASRAVGRVHGPASPTGLVGKGGATGRSEGGAAASGDSPMDTGMGSESQ